MRWAHRARWSRPFGNAPNAKPAESGHRRSLCRDRRGYEVSCSRVAPAPQLVGDAEALFAKTGATFKHGGIRALYAPSRDLIQLPPPEAFREAEVVRRTKRMSSFTGRRI